MNALILILLQTWWLSAQAVSPSKLAVLSSNDLKVIKEVEMPQPFRLSPFGFGTVIPPAPTEFSVTAFPKTIQLDWKCQAGHQFEVKIVRDGEVQPRIELTYAHNLTNFNWTHSFSGATNIVSVRRIHPESEWSSEIKITKQKE